MVLSSITLILGSPTLTAINFDAVCVPSCRLVSPKFPIYPIIRIGGPILSGLYVWWTRRKGHHLIYAFPAEESSVVFIAHCPGDCTGDDHWPTGEHWPSRNYVPHQRGGTEPKCATGKG